MDRMYESILITGVKSKKYYVCTCTVYIRNGGFSKDD